LSRLLKIARAIILLGILGTPYWGPVLHWNLQPNSPRSVVVIDYTVPEANYHPHRGLMWMLNHTKVESSSPDRLWEPARDYIGYFPEDRENPIALSDAIVGSPDLIYLADAYGVYEMDLEIIEGTRVQPTHSPQLFGGLSSADVDTLDELTSAGRDLFVEFNTLPPPTGEAERARMEEMMGVTWTGWVGRIFSDLHEISDVPDWFAPYFEERFPGVELPTKPCLVLFSYSGELIVVCDTDYTQITPRLRFTSVAQDRFGSLHADAPYFKWFGLFEPGPSTVTIGEIHLPEAILRSDGFHTSELDLTYPALMEYVDGQSHRYMLTFDGGNIPFNPGRYNYSGIYRAQALLNRRKDLLSMKPAFWQFYAPVMQRILRER
jgi:hypothetical protein